MVKSLPGIRPSRTVVVDTACQLISGGIFNIPDTGRPNVKASHALIQIACWLQEKMNLEWFAEEQVASSASLGSGKSENHHILILIGPGGTGKATVLKAAEALIDYFACAESVRKCAISNAAARLLKGDTLHALCKLPQSDLHQRTGKLSSQVLKKHRQRWRHAKALEIDEISMVAPDQLLQADVRIRQAKENPDMRFGGLITVLSGDFLQLPPIR